MEGVDPRVHRNHNAAISPLGISSDHLNRNGHENIVDGQCQVHAFGPTHEKSCSIGVIRYDRIWDVRFHAESGSRPHTPDF